MFQHESLLNQFFTGYLDQLATDVNDQNLHLRPAEFVHSPMWILGHLAVTAELGMKMLGGSIEHRSWLPLFAPGSKDNFESAEGLSRDELLSCIKSSYTRLGEMAEAADESTLNQPHGIELLNGTQLKTVEDVIRHLLSTHFAFHAAQLSVWRQANGHGYLF